MTSQEAIDARIEGWIACADLAITRIQTFGFRHAILELRRLREIGEDCRFLMAEIKAGRAKPETIDETLYATISTKAALSEDERPLPPRRNSRSRPGSVRDWLMTWLTERESGTLPRLIDVARECPLTNSYYDIDAALRSLSLKGKIAWRSGTRSENRGHSAIRVIATGRVLKTDGCPFEPPEVR